MKLKPEPEDEMIYLTEAETNAIFEIPLPASEVVKESHSPHHRKAFSIDIPVSLRGALATKQLTPPGKGVQISPPLEKGD